jgi:hypothetical protein
MGSTFQRIYSWKVEDIRPGASRGDVLGIENSSAFAIETTANSIRGQILAAHCRFGNKTNRKKILWVIDCLNGTEWHSIAGYLIIRFKDRPWH